MCDPNEMTHTQSKRIRLNSSDNPDDPYSLSETIVKNILLKFEKRIEKNQEMRIKYPNQPEKFMESEIQLNDVIQEMHVLATQPESFQLVVAMGTLKSLLQLLSHNNTDICVGVIDFLQELTDVDYGEDQFESVQSLIDSLIDEGIFSYLSNTLERLDESVMEEAQGVYNSLGIIENLVDIREDCVHSCIEAGVMRWILQRIKSREFDDNKLYCSEIMSIIIREDAAKAGLGVLGGIDIFLRQLAFFKKSDPESPEEVEYMENIFSCLCNALLLCENRVIFMRDEGLQLMNLLVRAKNKARFSAVKVLSYSMQLSPAGDGDPNICDKFVEVLGLRCLFPLFMNVVAPNQVREQTVEHVLSIILSLLRCCGETELARVVAKFEENDCEKVERLLEYHFEFWEKVEKLRERSCNEYWRLLEGGLYSLQLVDCIVAEICCVCDGRVKGRVMSMLSVRGLNSGCIRDVIKEYLDNMGDEGYDVRGRMNRLCDNL